MFILKGILLCSSFGMRRNRKWRWRHGRSRIPSAGQQLTDWLTEETENFDKLSRKAALKFIKVSLRDARACLKRAGRVADVDGLLVVDGVGVRCPAEGRRRLARCGSVAAPQEDAAQSRWL